MSRQQRTQLQQLLTALRVDAVGAAQIGAMLDAAANPGSESPEVILQTLDPERQADAVLAMQAVGAVFALVTARGRARLEALSDDEWSALVDE